MTFAQLEFSRYLVFQTIIHKAMISTSKLKPAKKFGPGYFIKEQMKLREWNQEELAEITDFSQKHLSDLLNDKKPVSLEMAKVLAGVFDTSAQYWLNLDNAYRLRLADEKSVKEIAADIKATIYERMPIRDMTKKGWIAGSKEVDELKDQVQDFWEIPDLDFSFMDKEEFCLPRKSEAFNQFNAYYALTWYRKAKLEAQKIKAKPFDRERLEELCRNMNSYTLTDQGLIDFLSNLEEIGVKFMVLPHLEKTYLDGAAFLDGQNPVVVYTGRYKRIDNFWFTIAHELAHVLLHLNDQYHFVLDNLRNGEKNEREDEANLYAGTALKHTELLKYLKPKIHYLTVSIIEECAEELQIHPSIIIGKLAHDNLVSYRNARLFNENVLEIIPEKYKY